MEVAITVNGRRVRTVRVLNCGQVGPYEPGDYPGGPGLRRYTWEAGDLSGEVLHRREDGAGALASKVLTAIDELVAAI